MGGAQRLHGEPDRRLAGRGALLAGHRVRRRAHPRQGGGRAGAAARRDVPGLFAALAEGLAAVHAQGVTHRDLKPQNVILAAQGPQLIDFGIARSVGQTAFTEAGFASGTPGFTAPEVLMRNEVGPAADVFALGATLAYAATGRPPFGQGEPAGVSYRAVHESIDLAGVEPGLAALIEACVAKEAAARPGLAEVIARCGVRSALVEDGFYGGLVGLGEAVPQVPQSSRVPGPPPGDPHSLPTAAAPYGPGYTPTQAAQPAPAARRRRTPWLVAAVVVVAGAVAVLPFLPDDDGGERTGAAGTSAGPTAVGDKESGIQPPAYVEATNPSRDYWTADPAAEDGRGKCDLPVEERYTDFQGSVSAPDSDGKLRIGVRVKGFVPPPVEPYYVSVAVKPPHEIDSRTGKPIEGLPIQNTDLGYTSAPVEVSTDWAYLTYPDDFRKFVNGKKVGDAIPVGNDPGDWTVLFLHVEGVKQYATIQCLGFVSK
ncbi:protein kinase [Streptomyces sp. NPDC018693]|uniref:protein kinase domain-containing protein n=1 Tax=unclassified Streptomyces TaxID=2593676 RepID=UPI003793D817